MIQRDISQRVRLCPCDVSCYVCVKAFLVSMVFCAGLQMDQYETLYHRLVSRAEDKWGVSQVHVDQVRRGSCSTCGRQLTSMTLDPRILPSSKIKGAGLPATAHKRRTRTLCAASCCNMHVHDFAYVFFRAPPILYAFKFVSITKNAYGLCV